jgi:hypothetical protein
MPGKQGGKGRKTTRMFFDESCGVDLEVPMHPEQAGGVQIAVPGLPAVGVKRGRSAENVCRTINHWLEIMGLWKSFQLEHLREARALLMAEDLLRKEVAANEVSGPTLDQFVQALREGYADDGGVAWRRSGGIGCTVANAESYRTLTKDLLSRKIIQHRLQQLQPHMKQVVTIESRLQLINDALGRKCNITPPPMVAVVYNKKFRYLGYHLVATGPLAEGSLIGYYEGEIRPEQPYDEYFCDPEYAHRLALSHRDREGMYFSPAKGDYDVIDSIDPLSCRARYISCSLDPSMVSDNVKLVCRVDCHNSHRLSVVVSKPIKAGDILKFYYGIQYWGRVLSMMCTNDPRRGDVIRLLEKLENVESGRSGGPLLGTHDASGSDSGSDSDYTAND